MPRRQALHEVEAPLLLPEPLVARLDEHGSRPATAADAALAAVEAGQRLRLQRGVGHGATTTPQAQARVQVGSEHRLPAPNALEKLAQSTVGVVRVWLRTERVEVLA